LVLALLNMLLRPILKVLAFPLIILSLGVFTLVINALMLWIMDYFLAAITIENLVALVWATIIVTAVNLIVSMLTKVID
jgi:putative membrane protein